MIGQAPTTTYTASVGEGGTSISVDFSNGEILWDDSTEILWDDSTTILWSYPLDVTPERTYSFSVPLTTYSGEVES